MGQDVDSTVEIGADGTLYFGSDDGYLYCVSAREGELRWKVRGVPDNLPDSRMLAGGRLVSRWPARGGPVEHGGVIYFGAGIWPSEGIHLTALCGFQLFFEETCPHVAGKRRGLRQTQQERHRKCMPV